jgi:hypothetical protein
MLVDLIDTAGPVDDVFDLDVKEIGTVAPISPNKGGPQMESTVGTCLTCTYSWPCCC